MSIIDRVTGEINVPKDRQELDKALTYYGIEGHPELLKCKVYEDYIQMLKDKPDVRR